MFFFCMKRELQLQHNKVEFYYAFITESHLPILESAEGDKVALLWHEMQEI